MGASPPKAKNQPSILDRALKSLIAKEVIYRNEHYCLYDVLFEKWLKKRLSY
jgi:hypothetical protein